MRQQPIRHLAAVIIGIGLFGLPCLPAASQTVYRCGNSYSDAPCAGAAMVSIHDPRSPAQKAQTDAATVQARSMAQQMERERLALEKSVMSARVPMVRHKGDAAAHPSSGPDAANADKTAKSKKKKPPEPAFFTAASTPNQKKRASGNAAD